MGVRGLSYFMRQHGGRASANPVNIRLLAQAAIKRSGQARSTVCVDGNSLLYHLYEGTGLNWLLGGQYAAFERKVEEWVEAFESCGIGLVVCFDGLVDPLKRATSLERRARDAAYVTSVLHTLQERDNTDGPSKIVLPALAAEAFVGTLHRRGVEVRFSNFEADRDIAYYCATHSECIGAVSQDSDFLIFDMGEACYLPLDSLQIKRTTEAGKWVIICQTFRVDRTAGMLDFDKKWMPIFASLVGNDYTRTDSALVKLHRQMKIIAGDNVAQIIRKVAKFLSRYRADTKEVDVYMNLMKNIRRDDRNHLHQMLKRSVSVYTILSSSAEATVTDGHSEDISFKYDSGKNESLALKFRQGQFAAQLLSVLAEGEYWAGLSVVDHTLFDPGDIYQQLRVTMYRILLSYQLEQPRANTSKEQKTSDSEPSVAPPPESSPLRKKNRGGPILSVSELMQTPNSYRKRGAVSLKPTDAQMPSIGSLLAMTESERLRVFLSSMRADSLLGIDQLPSELLLPCAVLRYLLVDQNDGTACDGDDIQQIGRAEPLLFEWEVEAYLRHLVRMLQRTKQPARARAVEWNWKMQGAHRKRFVCLASLLQTGLHHAFLMHQVCGQPLGRLPPPSRLYDGIQFLETYCRRWDARQAERRRGATSSVAATPDQNPQEQGQQQPERGGSGQATSDAQTEDEKAQEINNDGDGNDDDKDDDDGDGDGDAEIDGTVSKAKEAIVAGLRPNPASAKQRVGPSIFKAEPIRKQRRSNADSKNGGAQVAAAGEKGGSDTEEGGTDNDVSVHNSFALLG